eukprot:10220848-Alexandrium_andersonii.AAC.1
MGSEAVKRVHSEGDATESLPVGEEATVSCSEGATGRVCKGLLKLEHTASDLGEVPEVGMK